MVFILPNGKPIDTDMVEIAMEDADETHLYYFEYGKTNMFMKR